MVMSQRGAEGGGVAGREGGSVEGRSARLPPITASLEGRRVGTQSSSVSVGPLLRAAGRDLSLDGPLLLLFLLWLRSLLCVRAMVMGLCGALLLRLWLLSEFEGRGR